MRFYSRGRLLFAALATALAASAVLVPLVPAAASVSSPFTWQGYTWCPTYTGKSGCDNVQTASQYTVSFDPAQVSQSGNDILLTMNQAATLSGADSSYGYEMLTPPVAVSEKINLPCDANDHAENWPAFWMNGSAPQPPYNREIDITEGLAPGLMKWHYHYVNSSGQAVQVGGLDGATGNGCGTHTYGVTWTTSAITWYFDNVQTGQVAQSCSAPCVSIGVPIETLPMQVRNDYGAGSAGGPTVGGAVMDTSAFTVTPLLRGVTATNSGTGKSGSTISVPLPSGYKAGDMLIIWLEWNGTSTSPTLPGWTSYTKVTNTIGMKMFTRVADGTEGTTANVGFATGYDYAVLCADYEGVKSATPLDPIPPNSGQINNASTTITVPGVTTTQPSDELVWFGVSTGPSGTAPGVIGVPSGFTAEVAQNNSANTTGRNLGNILADKSATFIGATGNENGTSSTSVVNGGILVSLRSAAS